MSKRNDSEKDVTITEALARTTQLADQLKLSVTELVVLLERHVDKTGEAP